MTAWVRWDGKDHNNPIHHERPCTIEIAHARGNIQGDNQGRGLSSPWLNFDPESELTLSCMDRLMIHCFSATFPNFLSQHKSKNVKKLFFLARWIYIITEFTSVLSGIKMAGKQNIVCIPLSWLLTGKHDWSIRLSCKIQNKIPLVSL